MAPGGNRDATAAWFKCRGCRGDDALVWSRDCAIRRCCLKEKRLPHCAACAEFSCARILAFENDRHKHHRAAVARLRKMKADAARTTPRGEGPPAA